MISRLTKIQLVFFAIITVLGTAFVGGKYAELDRLVVDRTFPVTAKFEDSGGIFAGAEVTYRGIAVGTVDKLRFTDDGVDVVLAIEKSAPKISDDVEALVANKSAIGEQFVDLQPRTASAPFLRSGSTIERTDTRIPIDTTTLLLNIDGLVSSIDTQSLKTLVDELGQAFEGTGRDLTRIIDTSTEFIDEAEANLDVTRSLIRGSGTVLQTQIDKQGQLSTFAENLALFSDTLVDADPDLRRLLDEGTSSARVVRQVVDENAADLQAIFRDLRASGEPLARNDKTLQALSILYPYTVEGAFSVTAPSKRSGQSDEYDATFGLVITPEPKTCSPQNGDSGYLTRRAPEVLDDERKTPEGEAVLDKNGDPVIMFDTTVDCGSESKVPRNPSKTEISRNRADAPSAPGKDTWQWLLLGPASS